MADYHRAVELYPNSPLYQAKLAEACRAAGDWAGFRAAAAAALRLDQATPHLDKKLPAALRQRLSRESPSTPAEHQVMWRGGANCVKLRP